MCEERNIASVQLCRNTRAECSGGTKTPTYFKCGSGAYAAVLTAQILVELLYPTCCISYKQNAFTHPESEFSNYQLLHGELPKLDDLRVFGCLCFVSTLAASRTKFDKRARKCVFLGFRMHVKGAVVYDVHTKEILVSRNIMFHEHLLPYRGLVSSAPQCPPSPNSDLLLTTPPLPESIEPMPSDPHHLPTQEPDTLNHNSDIDKPDPPTPETATAPNITEPPLQPETLDTIPQRSTRTTKPPNHFKDYFCATTTTYYPVHDYLSYQSLSSTYKSYVMSLDAVAEPASYQEASQYPCWVEAMEKEIQALELNQTWSIVDKPVGINPIGSKWVYKIKRKADGSLERYKARLVAKGYTQTEGIDYFETFSPVAKMPTVRMLIALAAIKGWHIHQLDVNNAFLHGELKEEV